jgi:hypothetical protein
VIASVVVLAGCQKYRCDKAKEQVSSRWSLWASNLESDLPEVEELAKKAIAPPTADAVKGDPDAELAASMPKALADHLVAAKAAVPKAKSVVTACTSGTGSSVRLASKAALEAAEAMHTAQVRGIDARLAWMKVTVKGMSVVLDRLGQSGEVGIGEKVDSAKQTYEGELAKITPVLKREREEVDHQLERAREADAASAAAVDACGEL